VEYYKRLILKNSAAQNKLEQNTNILYSSNGDITIQKLDEETNKKIRMHALLTEEHNLWVYAGVIAKTAGRDIVDLFDF
jgi:hypothetical protein